MVSQFGNPSCSPTQILSWNDLERTCPQDIRDLIAYADISGILGAYELSSTYANHTWSATPLRINSKAIVSALETDNKLMMADADQWNFSHLTWNNSATLAEPLKKIVFLRAGVQWSNLLQFDFSDTPIHEVQVSFMNNAATRGDEQGTIPVIRFSDGSWVGNTGMSLVLKQSGTFTLGIWTFDGANYAMYELVIVAVI